MRQCGRQRTAAAKAGAVMRGCVREVGCQGRYGTHACRQGAVRVDEQPMEFEQICARGGRSRGAVGRAPYVSCVCQQSAGARVACECSDRAALGRRHAERVLPFMLECGACIMWVQVVNQLGGATERRFM